MLSPVRYETPVKHDLLPIVLGIDLLIGAFVIAIAFAVDMPWASLLTVPVVILNAVSFWLVYPRGLQLLDDGLRVKTGGLAGSHLRFDEIGSVSLQDGAIHIKAADGRALLKPLALRDGEEVAARLNAAIGGSPLAAA
jgi:hypothetical protein